MDTMKHRVTVADGATTGYAPIIISGVIKGIKYDEPTLASGATFNVNWFIGVPGSGGVEIDNKDTNANSAAGYIDYEEGVADSEGLHVASWQYSAGANLNYIQIEQNATQNNSGQDAVYDLTIIYNPEHAGM